MAQALFESLKLDLPAMAKMLQAKGRGKDRILAHITPKEAALLKKRGGRGSKNPDTGLLEFDDGGDIAAAPIDTSTYTPTDTTIGPSYGSTSGTTSQDTGGISNAPLTDTSGGLTPSQTQGVNDYVSQNAGFGYYNQPVGGVGASYTQAGGTPAITNVGSSATQLQTPGSDMYSQLGIVPQAAPEGETTQPTDQKSLMQRLSGATGLSADTLSKLGLGLGGGLLNYYQNQKAQNQIKQAAAQEQAIAAPYQQQGQELMAQAQRGELTPASQQAYQAALAQVNQGIANRGGVGEAQAANQLAGIYQTLLNNQYQYGLQVAQIGDQYALGAIQTQQQMDTQLAAMNQQFYASLAGIIAGTPTITGRYAVAGS